MFVVGQKVITEFNRSAEVVKVLKNGNVKIQMWVNAIGGTEVWTETVKPKYLKEA